MNDSKIEFLYQKLNDLPTQELSFDFGMFEYPSYETLNMDFNMNQIHMSPAIELTPESLGMATPTSMNAGMTGALPNGMSGNMSNNGMARALTVGDITTDLNMMSADVNAQMSAPLVKQEMSQMTFEWNTAQNFPNYQRTMSMPHIGQFSLDRQERKNSIISNASSGSEKIYHCTHKGCDRTFSRIQNMRSHVRCHLTTAPHDCKHCGLCFRRTTDLQRHIRTMHIPNDQKPWPCPKCPKRFGRSDALKRHMASKSKDHGCPGGPDVQLMRQMDHLKKQKMQRSSLESVLETF